MRTEEEIKAKASNYKTLYDISNKKEVKSIEDIAILIHINAYNKALKWVLGEQE